MARKPVQLGGYSSHSQSERERERERLLYVLSASTTFSGSGYMLAFVDPCEGMRLRDGRDSYGLGSTESSPFLGSDGAIVDDSES